MLENYLSPAQVALFLRQGSADQRHAIAVSERLRAAGKNDVALLRAALLHDVGKTDSRICLWHRVLYVVLSWAMPSLLETLAERTDGEGKPLWVLKHHEERGAALAREAGAGPVATALIANHHQPLRSAALDARARDLLAAFQQADEGTG